VFKYFTATVIEEGNMFGELGLINQRKR